MSPRYRAFVVTLLILSAIATAVYGKSRSGGRGRSSNSAASGNRFRTSNAFKSFSRGYRTSPAGATYFGLRWWFLSTRPIRASSGSAMGTTGDPSSKREWDEPIGDDEGPIDAVMFYTGLAFLSIWFIVFCLKLTFKTGQHHLSEFSMVQLLIFASYMAFTMTADSIPPEIWGNWFTPAVSFVAVQENPMNWVDVDYFYSVTGFTMSILILVKENYNSRSRGGRLNNVEPRIKTGEAGDAVVVDDWNVITKINAGLFLFVWLPSFLFGLSFSSWKIPLVVFSLLAVVAAGSRYLGLALIYSGKMKARLELNRNWNNTRVTRPCTHARAHIHDALDFIGGILSLAFHIRLTTLCGDGMVLFVNFASLCLALFAILFNPCLIYLTCRDNPNSNDNGGEGGSYKLEVQSEGGGEAEATVALEIGSKNNV